MPTTTALEDIGRTEESVSDILDVLDELTKPRKEHIVPKNDDGTLGKAHTVTIKPLLQQIREATYPSSETGLGSAPQKSTRSPIDFDALGILSGINAYIQAWCLLAGVETTRDPVVDLRRWYFMWESHPHEDHERREHTNRMRGWVRQIKDYLDPPVTFEADGACPVCGATDFGNAIDGGSIRPIRIQYRRTEHGMADERALCRACNEVWEGHESVGELAEELAEKRHTGSG